MSLRTASRFAARELRAGLKGFRLLLACLALGVAAIAAVGSVRAGLEAGLRQEGAALLGGDAEIDLTYRFATPQERDWMNTNAQKVSEVADFRSMVRVGEDRALTQVKAVDALYPLVGTVKLSPDMPLSEALAGKSNLPGAIMDPALIAQLGINVGDHVTLGTQNFIVMSAIQREPDNAVGGFTLGPRTMIQTKDAKAAGLLQAGTLFSSKYRLSLPKPVAYDALQSQAQNAIAGARWTDARNGAPGVAEFVDRLGAFLILVGLSGLAVGGIGVSAAVRAYLAGKTHVIATLRSLGADRATIFQTYLLQIGALSIAGIALGLIAGALAPLALEPIIAQQLPVPAVFALYPAPLIEAALYGLLTALIFCLWPLARAAEVRAATLYRDALDGTPSLPPLQYGIAVLICVLALIGLAIWFGGSARLTLWTAGGLIAALAVLGVAAFGIRKLAGLILPATRRRPALHWALGAISGPREGTGPIVLSLGLGLAVLATVGQIDGNLRRAISGNLPDVAPSYFLVDIQKDQMPDLTLRLSNDPAVSKMESAPMLRGIITQINGKPARDVAGDHWVLDGDRGITYADTKPKTTRLTAGTWWTADYTGPPQISFSAEEAAEMGLKLGDELTLNILGRDITATLTSLREVDFSSAGMGFILTINPAALAGAPHSYIATVYADAPAEAALMRDLSRAFPNITAIRVRDAIDRVANILASLATATSLGAAATLLTGFLVLVGAAAATAPARTYEAAVLKTLGATRAQILRSFALRAALVGAAAGGVALIAGMAGGWAVSTRILDTDYTMIWPAALWIIAGGIIANLLAGLGFAWRSINARPAQVLRRAE